MLIKAQLTDAMNDMQRQWIEKHLFPICKFINNHVDEAICVVKYPKKWGQTKKKVMKKQ